MSSIRTIQHTRQTLTIRTAVPSGLSRSVPFRDHRDLTGIIAARSHALWHTFRSTLAEADVALAVMQALLGHAHIDTAARYVHLAPAHVNAEVDAARARQHYDLGFLAGSQDSGIAVLAGRAHRRRFADVDRFRIRLLQRIDSGELN